MTAMLPTAPPRGYRFRNLDAAKRLADTIALHQSVLTKDELLRGRFIAVQLADGASDGKAYETRAEAVAHNTNRPSRCAYLQIPMERLSVHACDVLLWYVRSCYDAGYRDDPNSNQALILPSRVENL